MMKQYLAVKQEHKDEILFFRLGDFYEMFFDDAVTASRELELALTGKDCGQPERAPMCGVPFHSCDGYIARLIAKGYKVAICEQLEDPATAAGLVKRGITRVVTPGTVMESELLDESKNNYLVSVNMRENTTGLCFCDVSTGETQATLVETGARCSGVINEIARFAPREALLNAAAAEDEELNRVLKEKLGCALNPLPDGDFAVDWELLKRQYPAQDGANPDFDGREKTAGAVCALIKYLEKTQITGLERLNTLSIYNGGQFMQLDLTARRNLELCETMRSREKRGTLLWVLDRTKTAMGKRLIRSWLEQPLLNCTTILKRQNAVAELKDNTPMRVDLSEALSGIFDIERLMTRVVYGSANARDLRSLSQTIQRLPMIKAVIEPAKSALIKQLCGRINTLEDIFNLIDTAIVEEPPISVRDGSLIKPDFNPELDELRAAMTSGKSFLAKVEAAEREKTGIKSLKVGYNRVFGYYIEVTNSYLEQVPENYIRKQTLSNCERFITQELKDLESKVLGAREKSIRLEFTLFDAIRKKTAEQLDRFQAAAAAISRLDVLCSFALVAVANNYCCPDLKLDGKIMIKDGRHPVVEEMLAGAAFVPNDTELDLADNRVAIITGPNMSGKSTYMRQVALITIMAQIGSFVPASSACIGIVDSVYTRVGASDDLGSGRSTFMVEMSEVADILKNATKNSLLVFDEIGRGTSTYDGVSIAQAVIEYVCDKKRLGAKALFATHYQELTALENELEGIKNYNVAVKKHGEDITFLRKILPGGADRSYGIEVAKLAGIPQRVVSRAREILKALDTDDAADPLPRKVMAQAAPAMAQMRMTDPKAEKIMEKLRAVDVNSLTPIEALNLLFELCHLAKPDN